MPQNEGKQFKSLNKETGMLEDIEEVRRVGLMLVHTLQSFLLSPSISFLLPPELHTDLATSVVTAEGLLHPVSEADIVRLVYGLLGSGPLDAELEIRAHGLSETLPPTHPRAVARGIIGGEQDKPEDPPVKTPRVELPEHLEAFLWEVAQKDRREDV